MNTVQGISETLKQFRLCTIPVKPVNGGENNDIKHKLTFGYNLLLTKYQETFTLRDQHDDQYHQSLA